MARPRYDVALSFAGEQRPYVRTLADHLRAEKIGLFFDEFEQTRLWGRDLVEELDAVYRKESRCVIIFISKAYRDKSWTRHERRSALAAALQHRREYVLPVRFDDTELEGLPPSVGYLDARVVGPEALSTLVIEKLRVLEQSYESHAGELDVWRLVRVRHVAAAFTGEATVRSGGRWSKPGMAIVYTASSLCVAVLELSTFAPEVRLDDFVAIKARLPLSTDIRVLRTADLPADWRTHPAPATLQLLGAEWLAEGATCVLSVPSTVLPSERVYLLNPAHPDFGSLSVIAEEPVGWLGFRPSA